MVLLRFELRLQDSKSCVLTWLDDNTKQSECALFGAKKVYMPLVRIELTTFCSHEHTRQTHYHCAKEAGHLATTPSGSLLLRSEVVAYATKERRPGFPQSLQILEVFK